MKLFAFYNGCFWLTLTSLDDLLDNLKNINCLQSGVDRMIEAIIKGDAVFVNRAGGWHTGKIEDKEGYTTSKNFPTEQEKQEYLLTKV